jgi:hypothetical protein
MATPLICMLTGPGSGLLVLNSPMPQPVKDTAQRRRRTTKTKFEAERRF